MEKLEFDGKLKKISPSKIISKDGSDDFESFFLILAMIFNDLKGLIFVQKFIEDYYRKPSPDEISVHLGEYAGILTQMNKLIIATVSEFLIFLDKNKKVTASTKFSLLLKQLDGSTRADWAKIIDPSKDETSVISKIAQIRSNISFHFDHSSVELRRGFERSFFHEGKNLPQHNKAYFSLGTDMQSTRFYYADAAVEEYMKSLLNKEDMVIVMDAIENMNFTLQRLLRVYMHSINK